MKTYKYIIGIALVGMTLTACEDLDLQSKGVLDESTLLNSDYGVQKYFATSYNELPIEDFNFDCNGDHKGYGYWSNEYHGNNDYWGALKGYSGSVALETTGRNSNNDCSNQFDYWPYERIRDINTFIEDYPNYKDDFKENVYMANMAEARFLRAFYYFGMVKRYGGVPIIDSVQDPRGDVELLQVSRDTEYDCWKFIHDDLAFAMEYGRTDRTNITRANAYAAAALMSKAMLYAACVAKYGSYVPITGPAVSQGLMGMSRDHAQEFFQYAYDACKFIHDAGYTLHTGSNKESAYVEVFSQENPKDEDIFIKKYGNYEQQDTYRPMALLHCWDTMTLPTGTGLANNVGSAIQPVWELISLYELPALTDDRGRPVRFNSLDEIWSTGKMEPRCKANFFFSGMTESVSGQVLDTQAGFYDSYPGTAADGTPETSKTQNDYNEQHRHLVEQQNRTEVEYPEKSGNFVHGRGQYGYYTGLGDEGCTYTGTYVRKYVDPNGTSTNRQLFGSNNPFKVFRYGHILLDWAEAAYELGLITNSAALKQEAFDHVNEIRDRAGASRHELVANPEDIGTEKYGFEVDENLEYIRDERAREMCFENIRYWDLRRWRVSDKLFPQSNAYWPHVLWGFYVIDEDKYIYLTPVEGHLGRRISFQPKWYYNHLPDGEVNKNPNLVRNDGY